MYVRVIYAVYQTTQVCSSVEEAKAIIRRQWPEAVFSADAYFGGFHVAAAYPNVETGDACALFVWRAETPKAEPSAAERLVGAGMSVEKSSLQVAADLQRKADALPTTDVIPTSATERKPTVGPKASGVPLPQSGVTWGNKIRNRLASEYATAFVPIVAADFRAEPDESAEERRDRANGMVVKLAFALADAVIAEGNK